MVALWAQLQSVAEVVSGVALAGVLQGLTVLIAQVPKAHDERSLLRSALTMGLETSLAVALIVALAASALSARLPQSAIASDLFWLAALVGCMAIIPGTLNAYWLGKHQQQRMLWLTLLSSAVMSLIAAGTWFGLSLRGLMLVQCFALAIGGMLVWHYLRKLMFPMDIQGDETKHLGRLARFVPVGLAIGIMSPVSMLMIRGMLSYTLSWDEVGYLQALWRSTEWVTATAGGVLSLVFLPRLSSSYASDRFKQEMLRAGVTVLIPAAGLLFLIFSNQRLMLATLYDARFMVSDETAALFMLGSWIRIGSWLFLFGLYAAHRTRLIVVGEVLSLPLYSVLLWQFADGMTLERTALLYLVSYLAYLGFNVFGLLYSSPKTSATANS
jgi:PST family polysaccharide transporter